MINTRVFTCKCSIDYSYMLLFGKFITYIKNTVKHNKLFSERHGYTKGFNVFKYYVGFTRK